MKTVYNLYFILFLFVIPASKLHATSKSVVRTEIHRCEGDARFKTQSFYKAKCVGVIEVPRPDGRIWAGAYHQAYSGWVDVTDRYGTEYAYARLGYCGSKRDAVVGVNNLLSRLIIEGVCDPQQTSVSATERIRGR